MKKIISLFILSAALINPPLHADAYIEMTLAGGMTIKEWYAGDKSRSELPSLGGMPAMMGSPLTVKRLDKGVEWLISNPNKSYIENPIKEPYQKPTQTAFGKDDVKSELAEDKNEKTPKVEVKKAGTQKVAGIDCDGYEMYIDGKLAGRAWIPHKNKMVDDAFKQREAFEAKLTALKYADWPKEDRSAMLNLGAVMRGAMFGNMGPGFNLFNTGMPEGSPLKMEFLDEETGKLQTAMEVTLINTDAVDAKLFEIPTGYVKATPENTAAEMLGMDPTKMQDMLNKIPENLNMEGIDPQELLKLQQQMQQGGGGQ